MRLRRKFLLASLLFYILMFAGLHLTVSEVLIGGFSEVETREAVQSLDTARNLIHSREADLLSKIKDWSIWHDTYEFVVDRNPEYIKSNLPPNVLPDLQLSVMVFVNSSGNVVCARGYDLDQGKPTDISRSFRQVIRPESPLLGEHPLTGIISLPEGLMLVASHRIVRSDGSGPSGGHLIFGRYLSRKAVDELSTLSHLHISLHKHSSDSRDVNNRHLGSKNDKYPAVRVLDTNTLLAYDKLTDIYGDPVAILRVRMDRTSHQVGLRTLWLLDISLALLGLFLAALSYLSVDRLFVYRLSRLQKELENIDVAGELADRVSTIGNDEIASLAGSINTLLANLQSVRARNRAIISAIPDMIILLGEDGTIEECHIPYSEFTPYKREWLVGNNLSNILDRDTASKAFLAIQVASSRKKVQAFEYEITAESRKFCREARVVTTSDGHYLALVRDITKRKEAEKLINLQIAAINSVSDQIVITDRKGHIEYVNPGFERETGYTINEVRGSRWWDFGTGANDAYTIEQIRDYVTNGNSWRGELASKRKDGTTFHEDVIVTPIKDTNGTILHFVIVKRDITERRLYEAKLDRLAHHDTLTGLPNRLLFSDRLTQSIIRASRDKNLVGLVFLDLDRFKLVNDTLGHSAGDKLLKQVAQRLRSTLRQVDTIARMGGDEFILILPDLRTPEDASKTANRVMEVLSRPFRVMGRDLFLSASAGISVFPYDGEDVESLVRAADTAMYSAKEQGRNTFRFYTETMNAKAMERMVFESDLRKALEKDNELTLYYQPRVDVWTNRILGVEALIRWRHPDRGLVMPDQFIPVAEETGLVVPLGEWVLRTATMQNKAWQDVGLPPINMGINISVNQLHMSDLIQTVQSVVYETGLNPRYIDLELTESALSPNPELATRVLRQLRKMGVRIFIDDFGTGYSSLSNLKQFPVDAVKIDSSFIRNITAEGDDVAIASAIIAMAHSLKLEVIAEGVETVEQLNVLRNLGCDQVQGYFVSEPVPPDRLVYQLQRNDIPTELATQATPHEQAA
ncbi:MAG: EAL domain-containing protein [Armatimonadetes bacterium]|nr:EAL domain-containing protein [Armatimonadota bacterium]